MEDEKGSGEDERNKRIERDIAGWIRVGYKRKHLIVLDDGTVIPNPDQLQMDVTLQMLESKTTERD
jgi:hypothetical protein